MDPQPRMIDGGNSLLTDQEACQYLRIRPRQLYTWRVAGMIPFIRIGRSIRYRRSDLETLIDAMTVVSPGAAAKNSQVQGNCSIQRHSFNSELEP